MWRVSKPESVPAEEWLSHTCVPKMRLDAMHSMHSPIFPDLLYGYGDQQLFHQSHSGCLSTVQTTWLHTTNTSPNVSWVLWALCESPWTPRIHEQRLVQKEKRRNLQDSVQELPKGIDASRSRKECDETTHERIAGAESLPNASSAKIATARPAKKTCAKQIPMLVPQAANKASRHQCCHHIPATQNPTAASWLSVAALASLGNKTCVLDHCLYCC